MKKHSTTIIAIMVFSSLISLIGGALAQSLPTKIEKNLTQGADTPTDGDEFIGDVTFRVSDNEFYAWSNSAGGLNVGNIVVLEQEDITVSLQLTTQESVKFVEAEEIKGRLYRRNTFGLYSLYFLTEDGSYFKVKDWRFADDYDESKTNAEIIQVFDEQDALTFSNLIFLRDLATVEARNSQFVVILESVSIGYLATHDVGDVMTGTLYEADGHGYFDTGDGYVFEVRYYADLLNNVQTEYL